MKGGHPSMKTTYITRTQTLKIIKHKDPLFQTIDDLSFKAKNVYNSALYICRQHYFEYNQLLSYTALNSFHKDLYTNDYNSIPTNTTQQILMLAQRTMKAFINASKDFYNNPQKYKAKPRLPKYKHKTKGRYTLVFTNNQVRFKEGYIHFPASTNIPPLKTHLNLETPEHDEFSFSKSIESPIRQLRIIPLLNSYRIELVYTKEIQLPTYETNQEPHNLASIDLGINNFATVVTYGSQPYRPLILNGKGLKSYNKNFNKKLATLKSVAKQSNNKYSTKAIQALYSKRNSVYKDFYHKASRSIVNYLLQNQVSILVIGYNKQWKQNSKLSKNVNQTFIQIGFQTFIQLLAYKCQEHQIKVILQEESYTSGTSFLDTEPPTKEFYNKSRRLNRGLFKHSNTTNFKYPYINADINSAFQILTKATNNQLKYNSRFITQQSITPIVLNLDTFNTTKPKQPQQHKKAS
jgi:putative transposase